MGGLNKCFIAGHSRTLCDPKSVLLRVSGVYSSTHAVVLSLVSGLKTESHESEVGIKTEVYGTHYLPFERRMSIGLQQETVKRLLSSFHTLPVVFKLGPATASQ